MTPLLTLALALSPADLPPPPPPDTTTDTATDTKADATPDALQEAFGLVEYKANTVANLERAVRLYTTHLDGADARAACRGWTDVARAQLRLGDLRSKKKEKLTAFEAGKAAGERAVTACKGQSRKLRSDALAWMTFNLAKVGETQGVMNSLFMVGDLKKNLGEALKLDPNNSYARETLGTVFHALPGIAGGSDSKAEELFKEVLERDPNFGATMCCLGNFYLDKGKKAEAKAWFEKLLALEKPSLKTDHWKFDKPCAKRGLKKLKN